MLCCSVVLEMVEFIRAENIKALVAHLVEKFGSELEEVDYVDTFRALRLKYDQVRGQGCNVELSDVPCTPSPIVLFPPTCRRLAL